MRKMIIVFFAMFSSITFAQDIGTNPFIFYISDDLSTVEVEGSYKRISQDTFTTVPAVNSCFIECIKKENICREYIAKFDSLSGQPYPVGRHALFLIKQKFSIVNWVDGDQIVAEAETRALDLSLIIDLYERKVLRAAQETDARGGGMNPRDEPDVWIIKDSQADVQFRENLLKLLDLLPY